MKKTALFTMVISVVTLLSSCGGKENLTPSPTPTPTPTEKYAHEVAGTYNFYRSDTKYGLVIYYVYTNGIKGVFTATGDKTLSATFNGGNFSSPITENFTVGIGEDEGVLHLSSVEDKEFYYGDFITGTKSFTSLTTKNRDVVYYQGSVAQRCLASGEYPCVVTKNGNPTDWDLVTFVVSIETATAHINFGKKVDTKTERIRLEKVPFSDAGVISGEGIVAKSHPRTWDPQTATVAGNFNMSTKAFEVTVTLSDGDVYNITSK